MTENRLFTLSEGTRSILAGLDEPVTLRFYLSRRELERVPGIGGYADRVRALLNEYKRLAGDKLTLRVIDPEPFSEEEDRAVGYGLARGAPGARRGGLLLRPGGDELRRRRGGHSLSSRASASSSWNMT